MSVHDSYLQLHIFVSFLKILINCKRISMEIFHLVCGILMLAIFQMLS